jgi:hypothetical protein
LFAGLAVFVEFVVVVVEVVFETCEPLVFEFIVDEFDMLLFGAVVVVEDELVTVVDVAFEFEVMLVFDLLALVVFAVSPPQAAPRAAKPKSAESAIAFFMLKTISCLSQRLIY